MNLSLQRFVSEFWGDDYEGEVKAWSGKTKKTSSYAPKNVPKLFRDVERRKGAEDLYFGLSTQPATLVPTKRGSNETAISLPGVFADIDFANSKDSSKRYPPDADTALALLHSFEAQAFLVQNSGNGLHVLYKFDSPLVMRTPLVSSRRDSAAREGSTFLRRCRDGRTPPYYGVGRVWVRGACRAALPLPLCWCRQASVRPMRRAIPTLAGMESADPYQ